MTRNHTSIEQQVMGSVAVIYAARQLLSPVAFACYAALSFIAVSFFVSVPHVAQNFVASAQEGLPHIIGFTLAAIVGTQLIVQLGLLIGALASGSFLVAAVRTLGRSASRFA